MWAGQIGPYQEIERLSRLMNILRHFTVPLLLVLVLAGCGGLPAANTPAIQTPSTDAIAAAPAATNEPTTAAATTAPTAESTPATTAAATTGAATAAPNQTSTSAAATLSDDELKAALQKTMDTWSQAFAEADKGLLAKAVDPKALAFRRTQEAYLKYVSEAQGSSGMDWSGTVATVKRRENGYVQAGVDIRGARRVFTFKPVGGRWLLSEPSRAELGQRKKLETEHFIMEYYPWDADVADDIAKLLEKVHADDTAKMGKGPDKKTLVHVAPTAEATPGGSSGTFLAFYRRGIGSRLGQKEIVINSPNNAGFGGYDPAEGWQPQLEGTIAHEYAHLINDCCFTPIAKQNDWMTEGLAVYISEGGHTNGYMSRVKYAVQHDSLIPIIGQPTSAGGVRQDLENLSALDKDNGLAYGEAATLVDYIVTHYGGLEGYWKLVDDYSKTQNFDQSLQNVLKITVADLDKAWRADLKQRYGNG
jgi:hypothetical protein